jgi:hypothetical protein
MVDLNAQSDGQDANYLAALLRVRGAALRRPAARIYAGDSVDRLGGRARLDGVATDARSSGLTPSKRNCAH